MEPKAEIQPRMAAWLVSLRRPATAEAAKQALKEFGSWTFSAFIRDSLAFAAGHRMGVSKRERGEFQITNHDQFSAACLINGRWKALGSNPQVSA